jgi:hypothetical protein
MKSKMMPAAFHWEPVKTPLVQPNMETRKSFIVKTERDFEKFVSELTVSLKRANHGGWLTVKAAFESLVRLRKAALPYKRPRTLDVVESASRVAWEENHGTLGTALIFQIPKP